MIILLGIVIIYLWLIFPNTKRHDEMKQFEKVCIAHRGLYDNNTNAPENTLPAFQLAVEKGYGIELDVQLTKDKQLVVIHDSDLNRVCGVNIKIADLKYKELLQYKIYNSSSSVPLLTDVLKIIDGKVPLIIEIKVKLDYKETCEITANVLENYKGNYCVESFSPFALMWYKKYNPSVLRGQLSMSYFMEKEKAPIIVKFILTHLMMNFLTKPDFIAYKYKYRNQIALQICKKLYKVKTAAWTIRSQEQYEDNQPHFDIFIFDSYIPEK